MKHLRGPTNKRFLEYNIHREHEQLMMCRKSQYLCMECKFTMGRVHDTCPTCGSDNIYSVDSRARFPKKNDKKGWERFFSIFKEIESV